MNISEDLNTPYFPASVAALEYVPVMGTLITAVEAIKIRSWLNSEVKELEAYAKNTTEHKNKFNAISREMVGYQNHMSNTFNRARFVEIAALVTCLGVAILANPIALTGAYFAMISLIVRKIILLCVECHTSDTLDAQRGESTHGYNLIF